MTTEKKLIEIYRQVFTEKMNTPAWAVHKSSPGHSHELIHCPIPFVGKYYEQQETKILLYASAENLSDSADQRRLPYNSCALCL